MLEVLFPSWVNWWLKLTPQLWSCSSATLWNPHLLPSSCSGFFNMALIALSHTCVLSAAVYMWSSWKEHTWSVSLRKDDALMLRFLKACGLEEAAEANWEKNTVLSFHLYTANYKNMHSKEVMSDFYSVLMSRVSPSGLPHAHYWTWRDVSFSAMWNQTPSWLIRMRPCQHTMTSPQCPVLQLRIRLTAEKSRWWMSQDTADVVAWGIYCLGRKRIFWEMKWECV